MLINMNRLTLIWHYDGHWNGWPLKLRLGQGIVLLHNVELSLLQFQCGQRKVIGLFQFCIYPPRGRVGGVCCGLRAWSSSLTCSNIYASDTLGGWSPIISSAFSSLGVSAGTTLDPPPVLSQSLQTAAPRTFCNTYKIVPLLPDGFPLSLWAGNGGFHLFCQRLTKVLQVDFWAAQQFVVTVVWFSPSWCPIHFQ